MSQYVHGTHPEEQKRLTLLNTLLLNEACLKELSLQGGERILDVGSGLGQFSRAMAKQAGKKVIGIERSEEQINEAVRQARFDHEEDRAAFRQGDARNLPLREEEWGTFDVVHTRFVLEHVPDPINIVRQMLRATKKGGRIVLADDDHDVFRIYPEMTGFKELWNAYVQTYTVHGNDPIVGRKLVSLLHEAGARPVRNTWIFFGSCSGNELFDVYVNNLVGVIAGAKETVLQLGLYDEKRFDQVISSFDSWKERPDSALWYAVAWAEGVRSG